MVSICEKRAFSEHSLQKYIHFLSLLLLKATSTSPDSMSPTKDLSSSPATDHTPKNQLDKDNRQNLLSDFQEASHANDVARITSLLDLSLTLHPPLLTPADLSTALCYAVTAGELPLIKLLLAHGAPITTSANALTSREDKPNTLEILQTFLQHGWDVASAGTREGRMTMNMMMARKDSEELIRWYHTLPSTNSALP